MSTPHSASLDINLILRRLAEITATCGPDDAWMMRLDDHGKSIGYIIGHDRVVTSWWRSPWKLALLGDLVPDAQGRRHSMPLHNPFTGHNAMFFAFDDATASLIFYLETGRIAPEILIDRLGPAVLRREDGSMSREEFFAIQNDLANEYA